MSATSEVLCQPPSQIHGLSTASVDDTDCASIKQTHHHRGGSPTSSVIDSSERLDESRNSYSPTTSPKSSSDLSNGKNISSDKEIMNSDGYPSAFTPEKDITGKYLFGFRHMASLPHAMDGKGERDPLGALHQDFANMMPAHPMGMFHPGDMFPAEASKLLREMLQTKEKQKYGMERSLLGVGRENMFLPPHDSNLLQNGNRESDEESQTTNRSSPGMSDNDSQIKESQDLPRSPDMTEEDSMKVGDNVDKSDNEGEMDADDLKAKRARVENIISSMRSSPNKSGNESSPCGSSDQRKPKRKQYVPQQHEGGSYSDDEPAYKYRKVEQDSLRQELKQMQEQLSMMQKRYLEIFDRSTQSENGHIPPVSKADAAKSPDLRENNNSEKESKNSEVSAENSELDPSHFIKQASKLVLEQELVARQSKPSHAMPGDLQGLAKMLKDEIKSNVSQLVDSVVQKFVEKQKSKKEKSLPDVKPAEPPKEKSKSPPVPRHFPEQAITPKPARTKVTDKILPPFLESSHRSAFELPRPHMPLFSPHPYFAPTQVAPLAHPMYSTPKFEPEQTDPLPLVVSQPKKKRTKVTDTRLSPRAARALLQEGTTPPGDDKRHMMPHHALHEHHQQPLIPLSLPTSVAIPNPSLQHSDVLAMYSRRDHSAFRENLYTTDCSPSVGDQSSPNIAHTPEGLSMPMSMVKPEGDYYEHEGSTTDGVQMTSTLTPMHLRKAKLMFFYVRYPSSAILKVYFPDIKFNKNNTAQLVKWFSNFREFYYIQMEKYARQAIAEGIKTPEEITVNTDSELYRVLNLHYNRNNQIEVPDTFRMVVQSTLREFFKSVLAGKDQEQSWKKAIYKIIARLDDQLPEFFKSPNWMDKLNDL